jgi:hypothetical protein
MGILTDLVGGVFKPLSDVIDHYLPSGDAKIAAQTAVLQGQLQIAEQTLDYQKQLLDSQAKIVTAEAQGNSWLQRSWRPLTMLVFLGLVVADALNYLPNRLAPEAWNLLQLGLGGYVVGRSAEKTIPAVAQALTAFAKTPKSST